MTITQSEGSALAIRDDQDFWTEKQLAALHQIGVEEASNGDLAVFFHQCQRTGLDPFVRQVYLVGRYDSRTRGTKYTIQTGIDGFRLIGRRAADRRGETLELTDTEWCGDDGVWRDVWLSDRPPAAARVAVIRNGGRFPAVALFREYAQYTKQGDLSRMWADKGALMIGKCAEALAWRKAFPQDLSGLYTSDEMGQADSPRPEQPVSIGQAIEQHRTEQSDAAEPARDEHPDPAETVMISPAQKKTLTGLIKRHALSAEEALPKFSEWVGRTVSATRDLSAAEAAIVINELQVDKETGEIIDAEIVDDSAPSDADGVEAQQEEIRRLNEERRTLQGKQSAEQQEEGVVRPGEGAASQSGSGRATHKPGAGGCSPQQQAMIHMHFKQLKVGDRDERLEWTARIAGRDKIGTTKELSKGEASTVIDFLAQRRDYQDLAQSLVQDVLDAEPVAETEVQS